LVSTPENGVDSIALTYSLLDPIMTFMRPLAGFVTGVFAGIVENLFQERDRDRTDSKLPLPDFQSLHTPLNSRVKISRTRALFQELIKGQKYAFVNLFNDIAKYYLIGSLVAGIITSVIPDDMFSRVFGAGISSYLTMLILGLPMYVCATFSTPIAAAMVAKGLSPGAALVFLLAGPATNIATVSMLLGLMGKRSVVVYLSAIVICSLGFAFLTDFIFNHLNIVPSTNIHMVQKGFIPDWIEAIAAVIMIALCAKAIFFRGK
jgi:uncharacterized membrane protein YraQ (UPF0718 family)